jgi:4-amino-4-deoxy-L-arabinose transferase-like glycosyltransferase
MNKAAFLYVFVIMAIALFFSTYHLTLNDVMEWDEARNAINAWEMYHRGDYINLYYDGQPDTWNAKPPLFIWLVVLGYKIFGFNEIALRLPSVISTLFFFYFFFQLIKRRAGGTTAFLSCLILLGCNSIVTRHIGISGDFDALLICLLTIATYHFICFVDEGHQRSVYLTALFCGLAFYTKGTAALLYAPGWLLYVFARKKAAAFFKNRNTWLSISLFLLIAASWIIIVMLYGAKTEDSFYGSNNSIETMLVHDTYRRLTADNFGQHGDYAFVFSSLDAKMNMWNYLFYVITFFGLIILIRNKQLISFFRKEQNSLQLFSWCIILPVAVVLTFATNKHYWYLAPVFPYVAIITASGMIRITQKWKPAIFIFGAFTLFALFWHFSDLHNNSTSLRHILGKESSYLKGNEKVIVTHRPNQDVFLYLTWANKELVYIDIENDITNYKGQFTILRKDKLTDEMKSNLEDIQYFTDYCIARIK